MKKKKYLVVAGIFIIVVICAVFLILDNRQTRITITTNNETNAIATEVSVTLGDEQTSEQELVLSLDSIKAGQLTESNIVDKKTGNFGIVITVGDSTETFYFVNSADLASMDIDINAREENNTYHLNVKCTTKNIFGFSNERSWKVILK